MPCEKYLYRIFLSFLPLSISVRLIGLIGNIRLVTAVANPPLFTTTLARFSHTERVEPLNTHTYICIDFYKATASLIRFIQDNRQVPPSIVERIKSDASENRTTSIEAACERIAWSSLEAIDQKLNETELRMKKKSVDTYHPSSKAIVV